LPFPFTGDHSVWRESKSSLAAKDHTWGKASTKLKRTKGEKGKEQEKQSGSGYIRIQDRSQEEAYKEQRGETGLEDLEAFLRRGVWQGDWTLII
jgi:hypothetical protein